MLKLAIFILLTLNGTRLQASVSALAQEFLQSNTQVIKSKLGIAKSGWDLESLKASRGWSLSGGGDYQHDDLDTINPFALVDTKTTIYSLGLNKTFSWGGAFSFNNSLARYEVTPQSSSRFMIPQQNEQFLQTLKYTQSLGADFFGRNYRSQLSVQEQMVSIAKAAHEEKISLMLLDFFNRYVNVRLKKTIIEMQEKALSRAKKRQSNINKRVRDGLNEKVDLYQVKADVLLQKQNVNMAQNDLNQSLESLGHLLHRKVELREIKAYNFEKNIKIDTAKIENKENRQLIRLEKIVEMQKRKLEISRQSFLPKVNLSGEYTTNDWDTQRSSAFKNGLIGKGREEMKVGVSINLPIGFQAEKAQFSKDKIDLLTSQMESKNTRINLEDSKQMFKNQINLMEENIDHGLNRRNFSLRALNGHNRLFNLGRSDLDRVIRSEEDLIRTEVSLVNTMANYEHTVAKYTVLIGDIKSFLDLD